MNITEYKAYQAALLEEAKLKEANECEVIKEDVLDIVALKESRIQLKESYYKFKTDVKDLLLSEALNYFVSSSISDVSDEIKLTTEMMISNYVKDNGGCDNIISNARHYNNTYLLERLETLIEDYSSKIYEAVDKNDESTFKVNPDDKDNFLDDLDKEQDIESVKHAIFLRVTNAEEEFINNNNSDKVNIDSIIKDTTDRINSTLSDDSTPEDVSEAVVSDLTISSKRQINTVREKRVNTVFEQYVLIISESVISNPDIITEYQTDNSKLDMDKIVGMAKSNYAILETINSLYIEKIDSNYIKNLFK